MFNTLQIILEFKLDLNRIKLLGERVDLKTVSRMVCKLVHFLKSNLLSVSSVPRCWFISPAQLIIKKYTSYNQCACIHAEGYWGSSKIGLC